MQNLHNEAVAAPIGAASKPPDRLELAMMDIAEAAREGLLAMSVAAGMAVMHELMEEEVSALAGPKGAHDPRRVVYRHGHEDGQVTLGARRVKIRRPRIRKKRGGEAEVQTYSRFTSRDLLGKGVLDRMLAGISTRRFKSAGEPVGQAVEEKAVSTSKSAVSREFVTRTRDAMKQLMSRDLADVRLAALMIDGLDLRGRLWLHSASQPRASSCHWVCGRDQPRTQRWPRRCCPTSPIAVLIQSKECCSCSTEARR